MPLATTQRGTLRKPGQVLNNYLKFIAAASRRALYSYLCQIVIRTGYAESNPHKIASKQAANHFMQSHPPQVRTGPENCNFVLDRSPGRFELR